MLKGEINGRDLGGQRFPPKNYQVFVQCSLKNYKKYSYLTEIN